ncbi:UPF0149 family protein [Pantoea sp. BAV 3049]|uniref:UPF0149 family protein n=1 Tax=Pantoea sp. BAV 3049 TaxID=2654188 RepID=UPI00131A7AA6|nr:UPF0149 family protein [Pantoea sp. BAV 3049]
MNTGPLDEDQIEWLDEILMKHGSDDSVLDVSELDGMLTAILSGPGRVQPEKWQAAIWGPDASEPDWSSAAEQQRFQQLTLQHMNDIAERLRDAPDQFDPLFGYQTLEGEDYLVVEEWCFGYMRGVALDNWSALPSSEAPALEAIAIHADEVSTTNLEQMTPEEYTQSQAAIGPAAIQLYHFWLSKLQ